MFRRALILALTACLVTPLAAQAPAGMKMRVDRSTDAQDPDDNPELKVVTVGKGCRVTGGPAGVFWMPSSTAAGNYTVRANVSPRAMCRLTPPTAVTRPERNNP